MSLLEDVVGNLRAIIISSKESLSIRNVRADYKETFGTDIPLRDLGYSSLEDFVRKNPKDFSINGDYISAVPKSSSVHIADLVNQQNTAKKRMRSRPSSRLRQRRPARSGTNLSYKPVNLNQQRSSGQARKNKFEAPPRFQKRVENNNFNTSDRTRRREDFSSSGSPRDQPERVLRERTQGASGSEEGNNFVSRTLKKYLPITKTIINENALKSNRTEDNAKVEGDLFKRTDLENVIPFDDFDDYDSATNAQSRLIRQRNKLLNSSKTDSSSEDIRKIDSPVMMMTTAIDEPFSDFEEKLTITPRELEAPHFKQTAQSRLSNIKTSVQSKFDEMDINFNLKSPETELQHEKKLRDYCILKGLPEPTFSVESKKSLDNSVVYFCTLQIEDDFLLRTHPVEESTAAKARELASKKAYSKLAAKSPIIERESVIKLKSYCLKKNLPEPIFSLEVVEPKNRNKPKVYFCKVQIGSKTFNSFPLEAIDSGIAQDLAATKAYGNLLLEEQMQAAESDKNDHQTLARLVEIFNSSSSGIWSDKLPLLYKDKYHEDLQPDWFELIKKSCLFELDSVDNDRFIVYKKSEPFDYSEMDDSFIAELETATNLIPMPSLKLPSSVHWEVYITNIYNSAEVWCRLIGDEYSEQYDNLMTQLELSPPKNLASEPAINHIYAICVDELWNRVKLLELRDNNQGLVFYIDVGDEEVVDLNQLYDLDLSFIMFPPQAFSVSLHELDCFADDESLKPLLLEKLLGSIYIAEIVTLFSGPEKGLASVVMWDTSTDEDINVNQRLFDSVIKSITAPSLAKVGQIKEMFVSNVTESGEIFLQTNKESVRCIGRIIAKQTATGCDKNAACTYDILDFTTLYLTRNAITDSYCRAKVVQVLDTDFVNVLFIDVGHYQRTAITELYDLRKISLTLAGIPQQAICVNLANVPFFNLKMAEKLRELAPPEECLLVKVVEAKGKVPLVELFRRSQSDNALSSINNTIISDSQSVVAAPQKRKSLVVGLENIHYQHLVAPYIPAPGKEFDVYVTLAASPDLFTVQPLRSQTQLNELMFKLQETCKNYPSKNPPLDPKNFVPGELFAAKHKDGFWYRSSLHVDLGSSTFSVYLCDFGDFTVVNLEDLIPLPKEYRQFPYQAVRAKLAGINPANRDWSPMDCIEFQKIVKEKEFVSLVQEIIRDPINPNNITLSLMLIDVSSDHDVFIHQLLLDRKIAISSHNS